MKNYLALSVADDNLKSYALSFLNIKRSSRMEKNSHPTNDVLKPSNELQTAENTQKDAIRISINRIGNFKNFSLPFNAQIRLDWMNQRFESEKVSVEAEGDVDLSFNVVIQSSIDNNVLHQQFLDNPVYIVVLGLPPSVTSTSKKSKRSTAGTKSAGKKRSAIPTETVIGGSCLDVLPILMGSDSLEKVLPLQSERQLFGSEIVSWPNLPYVSVTGQPLLDFNSEENSLPGNYMTIGLEAIYNMKCSSGSVVGGLALPVFQNNEAQHEHFLYRSMKWVDRPNEGRKFKWANMVSSVEGCAANSEYEIFEDTGDISNVMDISANELQKIGVAPRLEWNRVHRCLLSPHCQQYVQNQIARYKTVPVEFMLTSDEMSLKLKNRSKETVDIPKEHLVAYPDLSRLMFPGVASIRLVTQIHTFTKNNFVERSGDKSASIFEAKAAKEPLLPRPGKDVSHKKSKGKPSSKAATASSKTTEAEEVIPEEESVPLQTKDGLPVFVVMQISLHKPLIPKKTEDEFIFDLQSLIPKRVEKPINIKNAEKAYNDYCSAIKEAHHIIEESYREYATKCARNLKMDLFAKYLEDTGLISKIKAHLRETVMDYMIFKIGLPSKIDKEHVFQDFLAKSYIKLVEDMRLTVTNKHSGKINSERSIICNYRSEVGTNALHIFACEAAEENDKDKAKSLLLKMIDMDYESPAPFIKMAILMLQENNIDEAETYTREVISIDTRHPIGLLLYAIILFLKEDFNTSELFLHAVTTFHPNFVDAWITFYFFYWHFQMFEEARIIMSHVDKLMLSLPSKTENQPVVEENEASKNNSTGILDVIPIDDKNLNSEKVEEQTIDEKTESNPQLNFDNLGLNSENAESRTLDVISKNPFLKRLDVMSYVDNDVLEPILSWFPEICDEDYAKFLKTAIFLLNLRCFMFAEMCLNKVRQLSTNDEIAVIVEYLLACCDYLQHRPENALQHLNAALRFNIQPTPLHLLSGHCYYKMENFEKMEESYSFVQSVSKRPIAFQLHLMYLRLGNAKFMQEKFRDSSEFYFKSCEQICSPLAWLGLAKSCYMLESYLDAERCLCEANLLDCENGEIWGYLALVNHKLNRPAVFLDCYNQTKRFPSNNEMLRNDIGQLYYSFYESNCFINRRSTVDCVDIPD